jgi:hypothetical protein
LRASLASYRHVRRAQEGAAAYLGFDLPCDDLDLSLIGVVMATLEGASDARTQRLRVIGSDAFQVLSEGRRLFWRLALRLPHPLLAIAVRQFYGVTNAKLLLNRRSLRRLQNRGVVGAELPLPIVGIGAVIGLVVRGLWQSVAAAGSRA